LSWSPARHRVWPLTYGEFIADACTRLSRAGVEAPEADAEWLLAAATQGRRLDARLAPGRVLSAGQAEVVHAMLLRRLKREPLAYILGQQAFLELTLAVTPAVLIPRPETERLVLVAADLLSRMELRPKVLDWGTGSGCIAIAVAAMAPGSAVYAVDASAAALSIARTNAQSSGVAHRIEFILGNGFEPVPPDLAFDMIVSNPPYIPSAEVAELEAEVRDHEPLSALDGGPDGLACFRVLAREGADRLRPGGILVAEFAEGQGSALLRLFADEGWTAGRVEKDLSGRDRILIVSRSSD
jgi:release factor glutamine methyltransferase